MECLECGHDLDQFANWNDYLSEIECPNCKTKFLVDGDEVYNPETSDCFDVFWLEKVS